MSIIEQATKRLEQLERAGVVVPWSAARVPRDGEAPREPLTAPVVSPSAAAQDPVSRMRPDLPAPVSLDLGMLRSAGFLVPDQVRSDVAEQFRRLKRPLLKNARAKPADAERSAAMIIVTSALPGEGKTFCSINLAMSMAMEVDTAVVLIDADVVRPRVFAHLGIPATSPGLLDLLTRDDLDLQDALVPTNVPKLWVMASGQRNERSTELLASAAMDRLLTQLAAEYADYVVIFDTPPLLLTTESSILASKVGQVVVVVEAARTARSAVLQAFAAVQNCPVVLSVLNKCDEPGSDARYGYHYD